MREFIGNCIKFVILIVVVYSLTKLGELVVKKIVNDIGLSLAY